MINRRKAIIGAIGAAAAITVTTIPALATEAKIPYPKLLEMYKEYMMPRLKNLMLEFNDEPARKHMTQIAEGFFEEYAHGYDWHVRCNEDNNTPELIDENRFIHTAYIKEKGSLGDFKIWDIHQVTHHGWI